MNDNIEVMKEKIKYFLSKDMDVHVKKKNSEFVNGRFLKNLGNNVYSFRDLKKGVIEVFVSEIEDIERYIKGEMGE